MGNIFSQALSSSFEQNMESRNSSCSSVRTAHENDTDSSRRHVTSKQTGAMPTKRSHSETNTRHVRQRTQSSLVEPDTDKLQLKLTESDALSKSENDESDDTSDSSLFLEADSSNSLNINGLPQSVLMHIFFQLSLTDRLQRAALVCKYWFQLAIDPDLWREIKLRGFPKVDDHVLSRIVRYSEKVNSIDLTDCRKVTDVGMENMVTACQDLTKLILVRCQQLTGKAFRFIAERCKHLKELNLSCCFGLDDTALSLIGVGCQSLVELQINQCSKITDHGMSELVRSCHDLERLSLDQCTKLTDGCLEALVNGCPHITMLNSKGCLWTAAGIMSLSQLSQLSHLDISGNCNVTDKVVITLVRGCSLLQSLNLSLCHKVTNKAVEYLARYSCHLHTLYLVSCDITDEALSFLSEHCKMLKMLDVAWCNQITDSGAITLSSRCQSLQYFGLMRCDQITVATAEMLSEKYPHVHYSTMWLDCKRVVEKAQQQGFSFVNLRNFYEHHKAAVSAS